MFFRMMTTNILLTLLVTGMMGVATCKNVLMLVADDAGLELKVNDNNLRLCEKIYIANIFGTLTAFT